MFDEKETDYKETEMSEDTGCMTECLPISTLQNLKNFAGFVYESMPKTLTTNTRLYLPSGGSHYGKVELPKYAAFVKGE